MDGTRRITLMSGALLAGLAVALGAFGAHGLRAHLTPEGLAAFETAVRYQMYHALGLLACGLLLSSATTVSHTRLRAAAWCFGLGILLFSGSLYLLVGTGLTWIGAITPLGGVLFIAGWGLLAASVVSGE